MKPRIPQMRYMEIEFLGRFYRPRFLLLLYINMAARALFTGQGPFSISNKFVGPVFT